MSDNEMKLAQALHEASVYGIGATSDVNQRVILEAAKAFAAAASAEPVAWRCPHDMGFDNELGPLGCRLVGAELECVCESHGWARPAPDAEIVAALEAVQSEIILTGNLADVVEAALAKAKGGSAPSAPRGQDTPKPGDPATRGAIAQTFLDETEHADTHELADVMLKHWDVRWR